MFKKIIERVAKKILQILVIKILSQRKLPNPSPRLKLNVLSLSQYINKSMANYHICRSVFGVGVSAVDDEFHLFQGHFLLLLSLLLILSFLYEEIFKIWQVFESFIWYLHCWEREITSERFKVSWCHARRVIWPILLLYFVTAALGLIQHDFIKHRILHHLTGFFSQM